MGKSAASQELMRMLNVRRDLESVKRRLIEIANRNGSVLMPDNHRPAVDRYMTPLGEVQVLWRRLAELVAELGPRR